MGEVTSAEVDLRVGGTWRYVMMASAGFEVGFHGEYREIVSDELIVCTEIYEGMPDGEAAVCTYTFTQTGERTTVTLLMQLASKEDRDMVINSGMESGMQRGWDIVEEIAVSLS